MHLKQLDKREIEQLKIGVYAFDGLSVFNESIPPIHVLERSSELLVQGVNRVWASPYLMVHKNQIVGCCGFKNEPVLNSVEIGYNVAPDARGQGFATLAIEQLCQVAINSNSVKTVEALIATHNTASLNVVIKNQFIFTEMVTDHENEELECWTLDINN